MLITNMSLRHRTTVLVLIVMIMIMGAYSYLTLPRESNPDIKIPMIMVITPYEGATPSDIESLITHPLERKLKNVTDVEEMISVSAEGLSHITLEFQPDINIDTALQKVREKVDEADQDLPDDLWDDPIVKEVSMDEQFPVMFINISADIGMARLKKIAEDMEEDLDQIPGVLDVDILGDLEREIRVEFNADRVSAYGLTIGEIVQTVTRNNLNTPGGSIDIGEAKYNIKAPAEFVSPDEIEYLVVAARDSGPVYLSDVATVVDTFKDRDSYSRVDGREAVTLKITRRSGENLLRIADEIKALIGRYEKRYPDGVHFTITSDGSKQIKMMVADLENNILTSLTLVLVVMFIALGFRNALLVALAIPFSMLISFMVIQVMGITLNMVVLFSLILALGMLVDNAIVIVENIYRHHVDEGKPLIEAARVGTEEVGWPVIASTATTVVAFFPMVFWPDIMGQFMSYLPKTVIIVLTASLFVALVITPTLSSFFIKRAKGHSAQSSDQGDHTLGPVIRSYVGLLRFGLRYRVLTLLFFFALLVIVVHAFGKSGLGVELFPDTEPNRIMISIVGPEGTNVYKADTFARAAEAIVDQYGYIEHVTTSVGAGAVQNASGQNSASLMIDMVDREYRTTDGIVDGKICFSNSNNMLESIRAELNKVIVGAKVTVEKEENGPPTGAPVNVEIVGDSYDVLATIASKLENDIKDLPGLVDLDNTFKAGLPEVTIDVDKERAAVLGLDTFLIGQMIKAAVNGIKIGDYRIGEDEYDITARLPLSERQSLDDILRLLVPAPDGAQIPLTSVARVKTSSGLSAIRHLDVKRLVEVKAEVVKGFNSDQLLRRVQVISKIGRSLLRQEDIRSLDALAARLREPQSEVDQRIADRLSTPTLALLKTGSDPAENPDELMTALLSDLNRNVLEDASFANADEAPQQSERGLELMKGSGITEAPTGEYGVRMNRLLLQDAYPQAFASLPPVKADPLPIGYSYRFTGENEEREKSGAFMMKAFVAAVLMITFVLVSQFNSILTPLIIMVSVILSFIGVFLGLMVTNTPFGIVMTGMGVISLAGVVVNNAIVLIDYTNLLRQRGRACAEAIIEAGRTRFRPVMLTAVTTVLGLTPMAVGVNFDFANFRWEIGSESSQWWGAMAVAVIFGLVVATALTLFVVPNLYSLFFDWGYYRRLAKEDRDRRDARREQRQRKAKEAAEKKARAKGQTNEAPALRDAATESGGGR